MVYSPVIHKRAPRFRLPRASREASVRLTPLENAIKTLLLDVAHLVHEERLRDSDTHDDVRQPELRFTGGWVRDKLRGVKNPDIDVLVTGIPVFPFCYAVRDYLNVPENAKKYEAMLPETNHQRGPAIIRRARQNTKSIEHSGVHIANFFRMYVDFINPQKQLPVEALPPSDVSVILQQDAYCRDATVNSLFYNLRTRRLEDYTERGIRDIKNGIIHTPGDPYQTLAADPVRMLRLIRLSSKLEYDVDEDTLKAMYDEKIRAGLRKRDKKRRVKMELNKILDGLWHNLSRLDGY